MPGIVIFPNYDIIDSMKRKKPLSETNPYLKDPVKRKKLIRRSVTSSCGVEGIKVDLEKTRKVKISRRKPK